MIQADDQAEKIVLTTAQANDIARTVLNLPDPLESENIPPSLLSAAHIYRYTVATGLISPFYEGGGRKARLKKASYEGRIGRKAYVFNEKGSLQPVLVPGEPLLIPANSIVFVESDLEFRLPRYIALRYNLQIRHVHRGLLLGTGPLVDPGYWGRLCIPLHNLTNEDYEIPLDEGLIWIEFTKTTSDSEVGRVALSESNEVAEHWAIEKFLRKAATPFNADKAPIGIRSSIPTMVNYATNKAEEAESSSLEALKESRAAALKASEAAGHANKTKDTFNRFAWLTSIAVAIGVLALWGSFLAVIFNERNALQTRIDTLSTELLQTKAASSEMANQLRRLEEQGRVAGGRPQQNEAEPSAPER